MRNLGSVKGGKFPLSVIWMGIAVTVLFAASAVAVTPITAQADDLGTPGISVPSCRSDGIAMFWHTRDGTQAPAPEGWKVERRHQVSGTWVVQTFMFIGADADALQTVNDRYWDWVDTSAEPDIAYTYRVRAINADGTDLNGRIWSRRAEVYCNQESLGQPGFLDRPGMSIPSCENNGIAFFWHTKNGGKAEAPDGWKLERRHRAPHDWVVETLTFSGAAADALQTQSDQYWDWTDTTADRGVMYTYRVRAIDADGSDMADRIWSGRALVQC